MRKTSAIILGKSALKLNKLSGGGTALPGLVAEKVSPDLLRYYIEQNFPDGVILVTGTNGKTTTARLIAGILNEAKISYVHNSSGSNLVRGILSALLAKSDLKAKITAQMAILEVDEATVQRVLEVCDPKLIVVTNLFRDQLDRYGEVNTLAKNLKAQFKKVSSRLLLNADDPIVASLALGLPKARVRYFGIENYPGRELQHDRTADIITSPLSSSPLIYKQRYLGHIGQYQSKNKDFTRPKPDYIVVKISTDYNNSSEFSVQYKQKKDNYHLSFGGLYNTYNALAAIATAHEIGIKQAQIKPALENSKAAFGRVEVIKYHNRDLQFLLIKNPTGFNQVIQSFLEPTRSEPVLILINDNFADGRDVSWLWDVAIEDLQQYDGPIVVGGIRAYDMALRLSYADIAVRHIETDVAAAIDFTTKLIARDQRLFVLPTYTAMLEARKHLVSKSGNGEFWQ